MGKAFYCDRCMNFFRGEATNTVAVRVSPASGGVDAATVIITVTKFRLFADKDITLCKGCLASYGKEASEELQQCVRQQSLLNKADD